MAWRTSERLLLMNLGACFSLPPALQRRRRRGGGKDAARRERVREIVTTKHGVLSWEATPMRYQKGSSAHPPSESLSLSDCVTHESLRRVWSPVKTLLLLHVTAIW